MGLTCLHASIEEGVWGAALAITTPNLGGVFALVSHPISLGRASLPEQDEQGAWGLVGQLQMAGPSWDV